MSIMNNMTQGALLKRLSIFAVIAMFFGALLAPVPVQAEPIPRGGGSSRGGGPTRIPCNSPSFFFLDSWTTYVCRGGSVKITKLNDFLKLGFWAVDSILKLVAYIAVGFLIWGGIKYIKSDGDANAVSDAKSTVTNAILGLVIAIASVAIVRFVQGAF